MDKTKRIKLAVLIGVPVLLLVAFLFRNQIMSLSKFLGPCIFHETTGLHCPGCGNTRAVKAVLNLHPIVSFRNNPIIILLTLTGLGFYTELAFDVFGKKIRFMPRNFIFWTAILIVLMIFYVLRNFFPVLAPLS